MRLLSTTRAQCPLGAQEAHDRVAGQHTHELIEVHSTLGHIVQVNVKVCGCCGGGRKVCTIMAGITAGFI